jgi:hypothetical protein
MTSGSKPPSDQFDVQPVDLEPTRRGYQLTYNYAVHFWLPILRPVCFAVWQALISFCFGDRDTCWPSISLLTYLVGSGNRHLITGRWRGQGETRRRQKGALEKLEDYGLLTVETRHAGPETRYTFHVVKEPPLLSPDLLAKLPKRLQQMHSDLLNRCGLDPETYAHIHSGGAAQGIGGTAQDTGGTAQDTEGTAQDTAKHYKESKILEEVWREAKSALSREITKSNFRTYLSDTHALAFDRNSGMLVIETPNPLTAEILSGRFRTIIMRTILDLRLGFDGILIQDVQFQSRR